MVLNFNIHSLNNASDENLILNFWRNSLNVCGEYTPIYIKTLSKTIFPFSFTSAGFDLINYEIYGKSEQNPMDYISHYNKTYTGTNSTSVAYPTETVITEFTSNYEVYGNSEQNGELYSPNLWQDGFINASGSADPVTSSSYPNAKHFKITLKQGQVVQFTVEPNDTARGRVRYIDPTTNTVQDTIALGTNQGYVTSTNSESSGFRSATFTALKDVTLAFMDIGGAIDTYTNFSLITDISPSSPVEVKSVGDKQLLPYGYTQLEYIESTGDQYIDTDYKPNSNTAVETTYYPYQTTRFMCLYGTQDKADANRFYALVSSSQYRLQINITNATHPNFLGINTDNTLNYEANGDFSSAQEKVTLKIDGKNKKINVISNSYTGEIIASGQTSFGEDVNCSYNLLLLSRSNAGVSANGFIGNCYGFKIWDNDILVRNLIPAKRNSDGVLGMYDTVTNTFFTNAGTGNFVAGNVIEQGGYKIPVKVKSKNLINVYDDTKYRNKYTIRVAETASYPMAYTGRCYFSLGYFKKGQQITMSCSSSGMLGGNIQVFSKDGIYVEEGDWVAYNVMPAEIKIGDRYYRQGTVPEDGYVIVVCLAEIDVIQNINYMITIDGSVKYQSYTEPVTTNVYLDEPLRKVDVHADYIDSKNNKLVREMKELTFTGYEDWFTSSSSGKHYYSIPKSALGTDLPHGSDDILCSHFKVYAGDVSALPVGQVCVGDNNINFNFDGTNDDIAGFETWLSQNNVKLYYPLTTPTETAMELPQISITQDSIVSVETEVPSSKLDVILDYTVEQYVETPTPSTPLEVESVGDRTKNKLKLIQGINLDSTTGNEKTSPTAYASDYIPAKDLKTNRLYFSTNVNGLWNYIWAYNKNKEAIKRTGGGGISERNLSGSSVFTNGTGSGTTDTEIAYIRVCFYVTLGSTGDINFDNGGWVQLEDGSRATEYEPYGYKIPVKVSGKNLFDKDKSILDKFYNSAGQETSGIYTTYKFTHSDFIKVNPNTKYTVSMITRNTTDNHRIIEWNKNKTFIKQIYNITGTKGETSGTFTTSVDGNYITINYVYEDSELNSDKNIQLEEGSQATPYEPYVEPIITNIYLNEPLRKIGDYADTIDFENQKVIRNIGFTDLKRLTWALGGSTQNNTQMFQCKYINKPQEQNITLPAMCNIAPYLSTVYNTDAVGCSWLIATTGCYIRIRVPKTIASTVSEFSTYADNNNLEYYYPLATPTEEVIQLPPIETFEGIDVFDIETKIKPSKVKITYYSKDKDGTVTANID